MARTQTKERPPLQAARAVSTQALALSLTAVEADWIIVAMRPKGEGEWDPTMPRDDWRILKEMMKDGAVSTVQRRDPAGTVLLARLKGD